MPGSGRRGRRLAVANRKSDPKLPSEIMRLKAARLPSLDLQQLWFSLLRYEWSSLVVVPADEGCSAQRIAESLAEMGTLHLGKPMTSLVTTGLDLARTSELMTSVMVHEIVRNTDGPKGRSTPPWLGRNVVIAIDPVATNPAGIAVAIAADAALLCVTLGKTRLSDAERTVDLIGRERFIGCVTEK